MPLYCPVGGACRLLGVGINLRAGVLVQSPDMPFIFSDAENRGSLSSRSPRTTGDTVSLRIARGPELPGESSRPGDGRSGGTTWRGALQEQDFQPAVFSRLIPPPTSPSLTPRAETHAALSSVSLRKQGWEQSQDPSHGKFPAVLESQATSLQAESPRHSAIYRCQI